MSNNNTQFNLLYIATKTSKSDPQNGTTFSALENGNVIIMSARKYDDMSDFHT